MTLVGRVHQFADRSRRSGLKEVDQAASDLLVAYLTAQAREVVSVDELVTAACRWRYERKTLIPSDRQIRDLARQCYAQVEAEILKAIREAIDDEKLRQCRSVTQTKHGDSPLSILEWPKTPPKRHSPTSLVETLETIRFFKALGVDKWPMQAIPLEKQRGYAQAVQVRRPVMTGKLIEYKRAGASRTWYDRPTTKPKRAKLARRPNSAIGSSPSRPWWTTRAGPLRSNWPPSASWWRTWAFLRDQQPRRQR